MLIGVEEDGDLVGPLGSERRRLGKLVPNGSQILILLDRLESRVIGILKVLQHPHASPVIEVDAHRLPDHRLTGHAPCRETFGQFHSLCGFFRGEPLCQRDGCRENGERDGGKLTCDHGGSSRWV